MLPDKINKDTKALEQELQESVTFETFAESMDDAFLAEEVGRDLALLIQKHKVKKTKLFLDANIHENYGYQLLSGKRYPSRDVLLSIFLSLHLSYEEVNQFLRDHGYTPLYVRRKRDVVIWFGFMKHMSLDEVDEKLRERDFKPLIRER